MSGLLRQDKTESLTHRVATQNAQIRNSSAMPSKEDAKIILTKEYVVFLVRVNQKVHG